MEEGEDLDTGTCPKRGGRKRLIRHLSPTLKENFLKVLHDHTAGDS